MATAPHEPDDLDVPQRLADDLRSVYRTAPTVSSDFDRAILNAAHVRLRRRRSFAWTGVGAVAAAVAVFIGVAVWTMRGPSPAPNRPAVATRAEDANADGVVDIRDALRLANQIRAAGGPPAAGARDVTGDGVVDRRDVDAIAMVAVRLSREDVR